MKGNTTREQAADSYRSLTDLVASGSILAVESGDSEEIYYLMRASGQAEPLEQAQKVGEHEVLQGTIVVKGEW